MKNHLDKKNTAKNKKNKLIGFSLIGILSILNIFSMYISEFIITRSVVYTDLTLMYKPLEITSRALNFTYLGLVIFIIFYFFIYKNKVES